MSFLTILYILIEVGILASVILCPLRIIKRVAAGFVVTVLLGSFFKGVGSLLLAMFF